MNKLHPPGKGQPSEFPGHESWTPDPSWVSSLHVLLLVSGMALALVLVGHFMGGVQSHADSLTPMGVGQVAGGAAIETRSGSGDARASKSAAPRGVAGENAPLQDHDASEDQLKAQYLQCASYTGMHRMDVDTAEACSRVAELLLTRIFDGDLDRQLEWWRAIRDGPAPSARVFPGV